ncbi:MAG: DUF4351 domain-containing protein [Cyanobium sp.]
MLIQRFPQLSEEQIMVIAGIPREEIRHTRAVQDWLAEGRQEGRKEGLQEGRQEGEAVVTTRLLNRRCGPLAGATTAQIQALPLEQLEALADALLDFQGPADLAAWLAAHTRPARRPSPNPTPHPRSPSPPSCWRQAHPAPRWQGPPGEIESRLGSRPVPLARAAQESRPGPPLKHGRSCLHTTSGVFRAAIQPKCRSAL